MGFDESELDGSDSEPDVESQVKPTIPNLSEPDNLPIFEDQVCKIVVFMYLCILILFFK